MRPPLAAPLAAVSGGAFAARFADFSTLDTFAFGLCAAALAACGLGARRAPAGEAACLLGLFLCSAWLLDIPSETRACAIEDVVERTGIDLADPVRLRGWVRRPPEALPDADRFDLELEAALEDVPACGGVRISVHREPDDPPLQIPYGVRVELLARLRFPRNYGNPGAFDRVGWLRERGIAMTATMRRYAPILPSGDRAAGWLPHQLWRLRIAASERLHRLLERARVELGRAALLRAMLLGDRSGLSEPVKTAFERSGTYHALVVSGLHVGVAAAGIFGLCGLFGGPRWPGAVAAALFAGLYALLLEGATPVSRAAWMLAAYLTTVLLFRQRQPLNVICAVAMGFLLWKPHWLADAGFQLSFLSVGAIAGIALPILERTTEPRRRALLDIWNTDRDLHLPVEDAERRVAIRAWLDPLVGVLKLPRAPGTWAITRSLRALWAVVALVVVSTVLLIALAAPLTWHFQRIAGSSPLTNVVTIPLVSIAVPAGLAGLATNRPEGMRIAAWAAGGMQRAAEWGAAGGARDWRVPPPPGWLALLAAASLAGWAAGLARGGRAAWAATAGAVGAFVAIAAHPFPARLEPGKLELTAIDVGQGEALLLGLPQGDAMLVDAGGLADFGDVPQASTWARRSSRPTCGRGRSASCARSRSPTPTPTTSAAPWPSSATSPSKSSG